MGKRNPGVYLSILFCDFCVCTTVYYAILSCAKLLLGAGKLRRVGCILIPFCSLWLINEGGSRKRNSTSSPDFSEQIPTSTNNNAEIVESQRASRNHYVRNERAFLVQVTC